MGFRCGIVGAPNVGKSTLFNALTDSQVPAEDYPFCTIDANVGVVAVPDPRLDVIGKIVGVSSKIAATLEFVDIAGLVEGASQGEGLGNRFLGHIREMDVIAHVVASFRSDSGAARAAVAEQIDMIRTELLLADMNTIRNAFDKTLKLTLTGNKEQKRILEAIRRAGQAVERGIGVRDAELTEQNRDDLRDLFLLTAKPAFYVVNVSEDQLNENAEDICADADGPAVSACAKVEAELAQLDEQDRSSFRESLGVGSSALDTLIRTGYSLLGLRTFFTFNETEVRAWTVTEGTSAQRAAGSIHTDMEKGFIRAEVMKYEHLAQIGNEQKVRNLGKVRYEGKSYEVQEGDILRVRFN